MAMAYLWWHTQMYDIPLQEQTYNDITVPHAI